MVRVLERLKKYHAMYQNNPNDLNVRKRISSKLPLFWKMYKKLVKKRTELKFSDLNNKGSPMKYKGFSNDSTRMDSKDFCSDLKSINDNLSLIHI